MFLNLQPDYDVGLIFQQSVVHITMLVVVCLPTTTLSWMLILDMKDSNRGDETWDDRFSNSERFKRRSGSTTPWLVPLGDMIKVAVPTPKDAIFRTINRIIRRRS